MSVETGNVLVEIDTGKVFVTMTVEGGSVLVDKIVWAGRDVVETVIKVL